MTTLPILPIGAIEIALEAQEILAGKRQQLTSAAEYVAQRRHYWQMQGMRPPRRSRAALPRRRAA